MWSIFFVRRYRENEWTDFTRFLINRSIQLKTGKIFGLIDSVVIELEKEHNVLKKMIFPKLETNPWGKFEGWLIKFSQINRFFSSFTDFSKSKLRSSHFQLQLNLRPVSSDVSFFLE